MRSPARDGARRRTPAVISGNVAPSSAAGGRISSAATTNEAKHRLSAVQTPGSSTVYAHAVALTKIG